MERTSLWHIVSACLLLAAATVLIYYPVSGYGFILYDDIAYTVQNPVLSHGLSWAGIKDAFFFPHAGGLWIPATWISFLFDHAFYGFDPGAFHRTNVGFHAANSILVFFLLFRMTGAWGPSLFAAALFAVHPLRVESVAWIAERKDVLSTFFGLAATLCYVEYVRKGGAARKGLVAVLFACGLMAKPMLVTLPFALLLLDFWPLGRFAGSKVFSRSLWDLIREKLPLFGLSAAASVITIIAERRTGGLNSLESMSLGVRLANGLAAYTGYIWKMIWPADLAVLYPYPAGGPPFWKAAGAFCILAGVTLVAVRLARRAPYFIVGWLWYLGTLFPVSGILQAGVQASADRFTYMPMLGLFIIIAWAASGYAALSRYRGVLLGVCAGAVLAVLAAVSMNQVRFWENTSTLFSRALLVTKNNWMAHGILGAALAEQGQAKEAMEEFRRTLAIEPAAFEGHFGMAALLAEAGKYGEAASEYEKALKARPGSSRAHNNLGSLMARGGRLDEAVLHFRKAAEQDPADYGARENLGRALAMQGKPDEAVLWFREALHVRPDSGPAQFYLGTLLARSGDLNGAARHLAAAARLEPLNAKVHLNLGNVYRLGGKLEKAASEYALAVRLEPGNIGARLNLGVALADAGRRPEAVAQFREVLRLSPENQDARKFLEARPDL